MEHSELIKIGGLWKSETKNGDTMLSGGFGAARILVLRNTFKAKDGDKAPDYHVFIAPNTKAEAPRKEAPAADAL